MPLLPNKNQFESFLQSLGGQTKLADDRKSAFDKLIKIGFPTKKDENWQFTNLSSLLKTDYQFANGKLQKVDESIINKYRIKNSYCLVVINGNIDVGLSNIESSKHIKIKNNIKRSNSNNNSNPFILMNRALFNGGYSIEIDSNYISDQPFHILNIISDDKDNIQHHHFDFVKIGKNCQVAIVEEFINLHDTDSFQNTVTQLFLEENSTVYRTVIQNNPNKSKCFNNNYIEQSSNSTYQCQLINIGGDMVRNDIEIQLNGENCEIDISGLSLLNNTNHIENYITVNHNQPHSNSNQLFKYILDGKSEGVFNGLVKVNPDAQNTNSQQSNKNIILSKNALMNSNPQLEIYADDVKCSHGSATGELEEDAIFYLRSRGIDLATARSLLIDGFAKEIIGKVEINSVNERLNSLLKLWLTK